MGRNHMSLSANKCTFNGETLRSIATSKCFVTTGPLFQEPTRVLQAPPGRPSA